MVPLFGAVPGGPEMLIMLLMMLLMLAIPLAFGVGLFLLGRWSANRGNDGSETRLAALRERVDELEAELDDAGGADGGSASDADN